MDINDWYTKTAEKGEKDITPNTFYFMNKNCRGCSNHPINGGSGVCYCILGNSVVIT